MRRRDGASLALTRAQVATGMNHTTLHVSRDLKDAQSIRCRELARQHVNFRADSAPRLFCVRLVAYTG